MKETGRDRKLAVERKKRAATSIKAWANEALLEIASATETPNAGLRMDVIQEALTKIRDTATDLDARTGKAERSKPAT